MSGYRFGPGVREDLVGILESIAADNPHPAAEPLYQRALAIQEKALGADYSQAAITLNNLVGIYHI